MAVNTGTGKSKRAVQILSQLKAYAINAKVPSLEQLVDELALECGMKCDDQVVDDFKTGRK